MQSNSQHIPTTFYRLPKVREIAGGVASSTIWGWVKNGIFPKPIKLSSNCTAWNSVDVEAWAQLRIAESPAQSAINTP